MSAVEADRVDRRLAQREVADVVADFVDGTDERPFDVRAVLLLTTSDGDLARSVLDEAERGLSRAIGNAPDARVDVRVVTLQDKRETFVQVAKSGASLAARALGVEDLEVNQLQELIVRRLKTESEALSLRFGEAELEKRVVLVDFAGPKGRTLAL